MAFLDQAEVHEAYTESSDEAKVWREPYPEYERLMDNGLLPGLDENLPEVNDGSLSAALFKLAKRVIKKKLAGRPISTDRDDKWINDLADLQWRNNILKNANSMATPRRKWKDAARKAAGYGGQPIITLFVERGNYTGADFIVPYCQDVKLEAGKASDMDSDIIFWDIYYTKLQVKNMIEQAESEEKEAKADKAAWEGRKAEHDAAMAENPELGEFDEETPEPYNTWDIPALKEILKDSEEERPSDEEHSEKQGKGVKKTGYHFYIAFQRGVNAPFMMCYPSSKKTVRKWSNPDPTGDVPVHYLYFYQDFVNPYGVGLVKLAGGTQNILDYFRQMDVLATQIGIRPPKQIQGNADEVDEDSLVYAEDANWYVGGAKVERMELSTQVYQSLPGRISMYQTSLQKMVPMGTSEVSSEDSGDPLVGRTPQALKMAAANVDVDDEDFEENVEECYSAVGKSMINTHFANMQGKDLMRLKSEERDVLTKAGIQFPITATGEASSELELEWDKARGMFDFELDAEADKVKDEGERVEGLQVAIETLKDPATMALAQGGPIILGTKKVDPGELFGEMIATLTDNDKIVTDMTEEEIAEQEAMAEAQAAGVDPATGEPLPAVDPETGEPIAPVAEEGAVMEGEEGGADPMADMSPEQVQINIEAIMREYGVPQNVAAAMHEAELLDQSDEQIMQLKDMLMAEEAPAEQEPVSV